MEQLIGRQIEKATLQWALNASEAELIAVYGRRRVGKTFLIRSFFSKQLLFEFSGVPDASLHDQLRNFSQSLTTAMKTVPLASPSGWREAFTMLTDFLTPQLKKHKKVIFFDEFPWIHTPKSGFMQAFEYFWNTWANWQPNLIVVICGSDVSWMMQRIIHNRSGFYNRVTKRIRLLPFSISETAAFLKSRKIDLDQYQLVRIYMAMGGIPFYLKEINAGENAAQIIDRLCLKKGGLLSDEPNILFHSLFQNAVLHMEVMRALAARPGGLTRVEIIEACSLKSGGWATQILDELTESGFITPFTPFGKRSKDNIYKITDEYSLFFFMLIENSKSGGPETWQRLTESASWKSWSDLAFESICQKHRRQIKKAIGIEDVYTIISPWRYQPKKEEAAQEQQIAQIDLLFDRRDNCINLCEIKFSLSEFVIDKHYADFLRQKQAIFREKTKTRKTLLLTLITPFGAIKNEYYLGLIQKEITMDSLFESFPL